MSCWRWLTYIETPVRTHCLLKISAGFVLRIRNSAMTVQDFWSMIFVTTGYRWLQVIVLLVIAAIIETVTETCTQYLCHFCAYL